MERGNKQSNALFDRIAAQHGVSVDEAVREIQFVIDATWNHPDPVAREKQRKLFPGGKPSIEEFIRVMAKQAKQ